MRAKEFVTEISRRGFLKGAAAGTIAGAALSPVLLTQPEVKKPELSDDPTPISKNPAYEQLLINTAKRVSPAIKGVELAQLLGQCYHETGGFMSLKEYGGPGYFRKLYDIAHNPKVAKVLGNLHVGDGILYHGRGFIQLTGRSNYKSAGKALGIDNLEENPELAADPKNAARIAVWYWIKRVRPAVSDFTDTAAVTKKINPKLKGLSMRILAFKEYLKTM